MTNGSALAGTHQTAPGTQRLAGDGAFAPDDDDEVEVRRQWRERTAGRYTVRRSIVKYRQCVRIVRPASAVVRVSLPRV